jgi:hypothetical protein
MLRKNEGKSYRLIPYFVKSEQQNQEIHKKTGINNGEWYNYLIKPTPSTTVSYNDLKSGL